MTNFLISTAFATGAEAPQQPGILDMMILPVAFLLIMYFLMIRPQQKKSREHQQLIEGLRAGDEVVTTGGIIGKVKSVADSFVTLEVSSNTFVKVVKGNVSALTKKPAAPAKES